MVRNKLCWDANNIVGLPKQKNPYQTNPTFLCFGSPTALFSSQHNLFRTIWPDRAKGHLLIYLCLNGAKRNETKYKWFLKFLSTCACVGMRLFSVGALCKVANINWRFRLVRFIVDLFSKLFCVLQIPFSVYLCLNLGDLFFTFCCKVFSLTSAITLRSFSFLLVVLIWFVQTVFWALFT